MGCDGPDVAPAPRRTIVLGVGNRLRGDDGAGPEVVRRLQPLAPAGVVVEECAGDAGTLIERWSANDTVMLVDAVRSGAAPGTLHRRLAGDAALAADEDRGSTHGMGVAEAIALSRALGRLPRTLILFGIEAGGFELGAGLSPEVEEAVERTARAVLRELERLGARVRPGGEARR